MSAIVYYIDPSFIKDLFLSWLGFQAPSPPLPVAAGDDFKLEMNDDTNSFWHTFILYGSIVFIVTIVGCCTFLIFFIRCLRKTFVGIIPKHELKGIKEIAKTVINVNSTNPKLISLYKVDAAATV